VRFTILIILSLTFASIPSRAADAPAAAPIVTTPQALVQEFVTDATAARQKYPRLTPFKVTGVVAGFGVDALKLKSADQPDQLAVDCAFAAADAGKVKRAERGQRFTVVGKLNAYDASRQMVELIGCTIVVE